jgi:hypothetical protein
MNTELLSSSHAVVSPASPEATRWTSGLWAERREVCREQIVPMLWEIMEGTSRTHYLQNFRIAAGLAEGRHRGAPFNDGDFYKCLEAICALLGSADEEWRAVWEARVAEAVEIIAAAQRADGYLHTKVLIAERNGTPGPKPFEVPTDFELYNMGHLFTAACAYFRATGKKELLRVARRAADYLDGVFQSPDPALLKSSVCPSHYMGLVELYRVTGERRYLELAERLIEWRHIVPEGGDDNQDRIPFKEQRIAAGHAVRANYLFAGAADVFLETGDEALWESLQSLWADIVDHKLYVTGGCGALYDGASPDGSEAQETITRVHQSYGRAYQLPNQTAHNETCAAIGNVLWNWRMFLATGEAKYVDLVEHTLFNAVLCGATLDGTLYSYTNPLRFLQDKPVPLRYGGGARAPFVSSFCCPPNLARIVAEVHQYAYAESEGAVWVNLYGSSVFCRENLRLRQETEYPWDGAVRILVELAPESEFSLKLRIPGWVKQPSLRVNDEPVDAELTAGSYAEVRRVWSSGDIIQLDLPMVPQVVEGHPLIEETRHQIALTRGPLVYCLESPELPEGVGVSDVRVRADSPWAVEYGESWMVLEGEGTYVPRREWAGLYREFSVPESVSIRVRMIPYFAWNNRGESEMTVWVPFTIGL